MRIGIDVGGTFTDLVAMDEGDAAPVAFKTPTTPADPSDGVLQGIAGLASAMGLDARELLEQAQVVIHGTTVATNTLVERKGATVGLITTEGFRDLLEIRGRSQGRQVQLADGPGRAARAKIPACRRRRAS